MLNFDKVKNVDPEVWEAICNEYQRQEDGLELIASENRPSEAVLQAQSSYHTLKYAEGYPREKILCRMWKYRYYRKFSKR